MKHVLIALRFATYMTTFLFRLIYRPEDKQKAIFDELMTDARTRQAPDEAELIRHLAPADQSILHVLVTQRKRYQESLNKSVAARVSFSFTEAEGCPRGIESTEKVLNCEIGFQDHEKVLNLATMYSKYWKMWKFQIVPFVYSKIVPYCWWKFCYSWYILFHE